MQSIPISQIVQINPRVVGAGGIQTSLDALLLTKSDAVPASQFLTFYTAADVGTFFGAGSDEHQAAVTYFAGILGGGQLPESLHYARYADAALPATVYGAPISRSLPALQQLSGVLTVTTSSVFTSSSIDLASATSFADAASIMLAAFTAPDFTITYDTERARFVVETVTAGPLVTISAVSGSLAAGVGLATSAGAFVQGSGFAADTPATAMDRVVAQSGNWSFFSTVWAADMDDRLGFAAWTSSSGLYEFGYVGWDTDAESAVPNNPSSFGAQVMTVPYQGTVPVYGGLEIAAGVLAWAASTNYLAIEGRTALAFRRIAAGPIPSVNSLATAQALLTNGYTYYGAYASETTTYSILYDGKLSGQFEWADTYLGQIWLRRTLRQALFETLLAYNSLPYNADGYNAIYQGAQDTIAQGLATGVIRAGITLSASQQAQVNQQARLKIDDQLSTLGWYLQVTDPLSTSVRTERGSPTVNFWYCDGGSIQKIVVSSTTVL